MSLLNFEDCGQIFERIKAFLSTPKNVEKMVCAAEADACPIEAVAPDLFSTLGREPLEKNTLRIITGGYIKKLLKKEGMVPDERFVDLHPECRPFKTSSTYTR
jgi:hypothetical protein